MELLLEYNKEDVMNLDVLRDRLAALVDTQVYSLKRAAAYDCNNVLRSTH